MCAISLDRYLRFTFFIAQYLANYSICAYLSNLSLMGNLADLYGSDIGWFQCTLALY